MKIILREDNAKLGKIGDVVTLETVTHVTSFCPKVWLLLLPMAL
jgi:hypothetical protein